MSPPGSIIMADQSKTIISRLDSIYIFTGPNYGSHFVRGRPSKLTCNMLFGGRFRAKDCESSLGAGKVYS
jgi:hypothetical protein